jgi:hypothetical protein
LTVSTRERPKLLFGPSGAPTHLVNGVSGEASCAPFACSSCKIHGPATFTLVAPLATA